MQCNIYETIFGHFEPFLSYFQYTFEKLHFSKDDGRGAGDKGRGMRGKGQRMRGNGQEARDNVCYSQIVFGFHFFNFDFNFGVLWLEKVT